MLWKEVFADGAGRGGCLGTVMTAAIFAMVFVVPVVGVFVLCVQFTPVLQDLFGVYAAPSSFAEQFGLFSRGLNDWARIATGVLSTLAMLGAAVRGAGTVSGERDRDTWISLISTPLTTGEMLRGKFLGVVLGMRRIYTALLLVWAIALAFGEVEPVLVAASILFLAVYVSAFAWLGIFCSITARTTMIATVRAILAAGFFIGGYLIVGTFCCVLPVGLVIDTRALSGSGADGEPLESIGLVVLGAVPPLVMGWLPMHDFDGKRDDLLMFQSSSATIGVFAPVVGLAVWAAFGTVLAAVSHARFAGLSNRGADRPPRSEKRP